MWLVEPKYARPALTGAGKTALSQSIEWVGLYDWCIGGDGFSFADLTEALWTSGRMSGADWHLLSRAASLYAVGTGAPSNRCHTLRWHVRRNLGTSPFWAHQQSWRRKWTGVERGSRFGWIGGLLVIFDKPFCKFKVHPSWYVFTLSQSRPLLKRWHVACLSNGEKWLSVCQCLER